jgi:tetratricopeptide (TPR) repeat protein
MNQELPPAAQKDFQRAVALFNEGRLATAEGICADLIARYPLDADIAHFGGVLANRMGRFDIAVQRLTRSAQANPPRAKALGALGFAQERLGRFDEARASFGAAIRAEPTFAEAHNGLGLTLVRTGNPAEALPYFDRAIALRPTMLEGRLNAAHALMEMGRVAQAATHFREAANLAPDRDDVLWAAAVGLHQADDFDNAERLLRAMLARNSANARAHARLALVLEAKGQEDAALQSVEAALASGAGDATVLNIHGLMLLNRKRPREAQEAFRKALAADPKLGEAAVNLAAALREAGQLDEARAQMQAARGMLDAIGLAQLAAYSAGVGDSDACIEIAEQAIAQSPHLQIAHGTLALELLRSGRTERGWREHLYRPSRGNEILGAIISGSYPPPLPADLAGRDVVILAEQGLGDMLFFLRFAKPLADAGARLHIRRLEPRLVPIVQRALDIDLWPEERPFDASTVALWAGDLPLFVRPLTGADTAPSLRAAPLAGRVELMRERLGATNRRRIGVAWRAGTVATPMSGRKSYLYKDLSPRMLGECLAGLPVDVVSIQRAPAEGATNELEQAFGASVIDCSDVNADLEDTLALLSLLDGYVGVSSTNIHLLGLLGHTGRVLIPFPPDWRWQSRGESLWHPGFMTYRQSPDRDWSGALRALREDLALEVKA